MLVPVGTYARIFLLGTDEPGTAGSGSVMQGGRCPLGLGRGSLVLHHTTLYFYSSGIVIL